MTHFTHLSLKSKISFCEVQSVVPQKGCQEINWAHLLWAANHSGLSWLPRPFRAKMLKKLGKFQAKWNESIPLSMPVKVTAMD
jgi:hypothetical protein